MDKEKKRTCRQETQPSHFFCGVPRVPADCIRGCFFFTQEGGADVPESRLAVSLFSFCYPVPGSPALPRRSLTRRWRFLFFLRVGLQQEGHLQASSKWEIVGRLPWRPLKSALLKRLLCCCRRGRLLWGMPDLLRGEECAGGLRREGHQGGHVPSDLFHKLFLIAFLLFNVSMPPAPNRLWTVPK